MQVVTAALDAAFGGGCGGIVARYRGNWRGEDGNAGVSGKAARALPARKQAAPEDSERRTSKCFSPT